VGGGIYLYIAYMGSFGIWHRFYTGQDKVQTIEGYFNDGAWQTKFIEATYMIHLYTVFP